MTAQDPMTVEEIVGQRIRQSREHHGWTQEELGRRLGDYLEKEWPRQAIYEAEKGMRGFRAVELAAFSRVLDVPLGWLIGPVAGELMRFPSGAAFDVDEWRPKYDDRDIKTLDQAYFMASLAIAMGTIQEGVFTVMDGLTKMSGMMGEAGALLETLMKEGEEE